MAIYIHITCIFWIISLPHHYLQLQKIGTFLNKICPCDKPSKDDIFVHGWLEVLRLHFCDTASHLRAEGSCSFFPMPALVYYFGVTCKQATRCNFDYKDYHDFPWRCQMHTASGSVICTHIHRSVIRCLNLCTHFRVAFIYRNRALKLFASVSRVKAAIHHFLHVENHKEEEVSSVTLVTFHHLGM